MANQQGARKSIWQRFTSFYQSIDGKADSLLESEDTTSVPGMKKEDTRISPENKAQSSADLGLSPLEIYIHSIDVKSSSGLRKVRDLSEKAKKNSWFFGVISAILFVLAVGSYFSYFFWDWYKTTNPTVSQPMPMRVISMDIQAPDVVIEKETFRVWVTVMENGVPKPGIVVVFDAKQPEMANDVASSTITDFYGRVWVEYEAVGQDGFVDIQISADGVTRIITVRLARLTDDQLDTDKDGVSDFQEKILGTDFSNLDTDLDSVSDGIEMFVLHTDPLIGNLYQSLCGLGSDQTKILKLRKSSLDLWQSQNDPKDAGLGDFAFSPNQTYSFFVISVDTIDSTQNPTSTYAYVLFKISGDYATSFISSEENAVKTFIKPGLIPLSNGGPAISLKEEFPVYRIGINQEIWLTGYVPFRLLELPRSCE